jgi:hypothetical protein
MTPIQQKEMRRFTRDMWSLLRYMAEPREPDDTPLLFGAWGANGGNFTALGSKLT